MVIAGRSVHLLSLADALIFLSLIFLSICFSRSVVNILKFQTSFHFILFSKIMLVSKAGICKMLVRIANREDPNPPASSKVV